MSCRYLNLRKIYDHKLDQEKTNLNRCVLRIITAGVFILKCDMQIDAIIIYAKCLSPAVISWKTCFNAQDLSRSQTWVESLYAILQT